jgi:hypothetical protein
MVKKSSNQKNLLNSTTYTSKILSEAPTADRKSPKVFDKSQNKKLVNLTSKILSETPTADRKSPK